MKDPQQRLKELWALDKKMMKHLQKHQFRNRAKDVSYQADHDAQEISIRRAEEGRGRW